MTTDLDTLLTALYVLTGDHIIEPGQRRLGHPRKLTGAELVCLAVAQVLLGARSEHHWLRMCYGRLGHLFPCLPHQPGSHKRLKAAAPLIATTMAHLARRSPSWADGLRLLDATAVPCGTSRQTVRRPELAGWADYGYGAAHSRWYWGLKLYLLATAEGMPVSWCLAGPKIGEREAAAELPAHARHTGALPPQMIVLADKGLAGREMERYATEQIGVLLARPDRKDERRRFGNLAGRRQWIEAILGTLNGQLDLERHGGRTPAGVCTRVAQRLLARAAAIWHNWTISTTSGRSLIAYDH